MIYIFSSHYFCLPFFQPFLSKSDFASISYNIFSELFQIMFDLAGNLRSQNQIR